MSAQNSNYSLVFIGQSVNILIDRPLGSVHHQYDFVYKVNYGYLPGVLSPDGEALDAYILGVEIPLREYEGICIAVIHRLDDDDDKLIVVPPDTEWTDAQIWANVNFQEQFFHGVILRGQ